MGPAMDNQAKTNFPSSPAGATLESLAALIADDSYAVSFQSMGQYRSALLRAIHDIGQAAPDNALGEKGGDDA